jgi:hypothetical protein
MTNFAKLVQIKNWRISQNLTRLESLRSIDWHGSSFIQRSVRICLVWSHVRAGNRVVKCPRPQT